MLARVKLFFMMIVIGGSKVFGQVCDENCFPNEMLPNGGPQQSDEVRVEETSRYAAPEISSNEKDSINALTQSFLQLRQPFDLSNVSGASKVCRDDSRKYAEALLESEFWALKMHDATAKLSSGLLNGNVNNFGDFDQCLSVKARSDGFRGKYCLAWLQPKVSESLKYTNFLRKQLQSYEAYKSTFDDSGHSIARFSTINFAVCIPSTCSNQDVELGLRNVVETFTYGSLVEVDIKVDEEMCKVEDEDWLRNLDIGTRTTIVLCLLLVVLIGASTVYDLQKSFPNKSKLLTSFSLLRNFQTLTSQERDAGDIRSAHSIRFIHAVLLVLSHKAGAFSFNPCTNRTRTVQLLDGPWSGIIRAGSLYTDLFLMLSGMLTAYSLFGKLKRRGEIKVLKEYASRYLRIMPSLAFLIVFCTFILPLLGDGPQWSLVVDHNASLCKQHWWRNLLFIHNWFGFANMCLTHTHHIGVDTELFLLAPLMVLIMWKWPKQGVGAIIVLAIMSTCARYYVTYNNELSYCANFGARLKKLYEFTDKLYTLPPYRFTVYAVGVCLGYILRMVKKFELTPVQLTVGWSLSSSMFLLTLSSLVFLGSAGYEYNATHAAYFAAFAPITWCIFFGWIIFVAQMGHTNILIRALEWKGFLVTTKISYALYLVQFPVFYYNVGRVRTSVHFGFLAVLMDLNEYFGIILGSLALILFIELPFNNVRALLLDENQLKKMN